MATFAYATTATAIAAFLILLPLSCSSESILDHHDDDSSSSVTQSDVDLLEFPLNLEYLEAEFSLYGAFGRGLDTVDPSLTLGGPTPVGAKRAHLDHFTRDVITQFAWQEVGHLRSLIFNSFVEGRVHEPLDLWKRMICEGFRPNIVAYTTRIHDLCTNGKMGDAVSVCYEMERNGSPRPHIALLLMALQKQVPLLAALHLYNMMNRGCRPNEFLNGLFKANRFEEAYGIVRGDRGNKDGTEFGNLQYHFEWFFFRLVREGSLIPSHIIRLYMPIASKVRLALPSHGMH